MKQFFFIKNFLIERGKKKRDKFGSQPSGWTSISLTSWLSHPCVVPTYNEQGLVCLLIENDRSDSVRYSRPNKRHRNFCLPLWNCSLSRKTVATEVAQGEARVGRKWDLPTTTTSLPIMWMSHPGSESLGPWRLGRNIVPSKLWLEPHERWS